MSVIPLIPPLGGVSDATAFEDQDLRTTTSAKNVDPIDPLTGRERIATRSGMERFTPDPLGVARVQHGTYVTSTQRQITYAHGSGSIEYEDTTPTHGPCPAVQTDSQGATYWVDGPVGIVKHGGDGTRVWQFTVPVKDTTHVIRALWMDQTRDHLFVAVSEGSAQGEARIWCYEKDDEKHLKLFWSLPIRPGAFVEQMFVHEGKLYTGQNFTNEGRSKIVVYDFIDTSVPEEAWSKDDVPYPISGLGVNSKGDIICCHPAQAARYYDARAPNETQIMDNPRWRPQDDPNYEKWHWCSLVASEIPNQPGFKQIQDGDPVTEWRDSGFRGLVTFKPDTAIISSGTYDGLPFLTPFWKKRSLGFKPAVAFRGNRYRLVSEPSAGNTVSVGDILSTLLPGKGRGSIICCLLKVSEDTPTGGAVKKGRVWAQQNDNASAAGLRALYVNRDNTSGGGHVGGALANMVSTTIQNRTGAAGTTDPSAVMGQFNNVSGAVIVTIATGNNVTALDRGCFRVNGVPLAYFDSYQFWTDPDATLGRAILGCTSTGTEGPSIDLLEVHVFQSAQINGVETLPDFPDYNIATNVNTSDPATSDTFVERLEGWVAIRNGVSQLLDRGDQTGTTVVWDAGGGASAYGHPFSLNPLSPTSSGAPPNPNGRDGDANGASWDAILIRPTQLLTKWSPTRGTVKWATGGNTTGGTGYGLAILSDDDIITVGAVTNTTSGNPGAKSIRKWRDNGDTVSQVWTSELLDSGGFAVGYGYAHPRMVVDKFDNVWIPFNWPDADEQHSLIGIKSGSAVALRFDLSAVQAGLCCALPPTTPDYTGNPTAITRPEFVYLGSEGDDVEAAIHKVRVVDATQTNNPPRLTRAVTVIGGTVVTATSGASGVPTGGSSVLDANANLISSAVAQGKVYLTDGRRNISYDPLTDVVETARASDSGEMPTRCKLLISHADRLVWGANEEQPQNWFMSEKGAGTHYDYFPSAGAIEGMAVAGNSGTIDGVKPAPDRITSLWSRSRELLLFGCDASIHAMVGDPTAGGYIDLLTEEMGMAFGYPCTNGPDGTGFFVNNRAEVCALTGSRIDRISTNIDRRLRDLDLALHRFELQWDTENDRLLVFVIPLQSTATPVTCWQWNRKRGSWWPIEFSQSILQPTCSFVMDGDGATDRALLMGCQDGVLRKFSRTARTDDGYTIDSYLVLGPYFGKTDQTRLKNIQVNLSNTQDGCRMELFSSPTADNMGAVKCWADLMPGPNPVQFMGVRDTFAWMRLRNALTGQRFALESGTAELWDSGRRQAV